MCELFDELTDLGAAPIDLSDDADARWLLACVWPDTGRSARVRASIELAREHPVRMVAGRANDVLPDVFDELPDVLGAIVFGDGTPTPHLLGYVQSHGNWIDWRGAT